MNKNEIKVSVVIPVYNGMPYLKETVKAILHQTHQNFELIIIDDGSNDESKKYLKSIQDSRVKLIIQTNIGLSNSLNKAFALAKGKYIIRNDQDDVSEIDRIEKQVKVLEESAFDCVFTHITKISKTKEWSNLDKLVDKKKSIRIFNPWIDGCIVNSTMAIKTDIFHEIGGYRQEYYPSDDWDLELRLSQKFSIGIIEESLLRYRFHDSANTYKYWQIMQDKRRWAEDSYFKRKENKDELIYEDFLFRQKKNLFINFNRSRKDKAKLFMRKAGSSFLSKKYFSLFKYFVLTILFHPKEVLKRSFKLISNIIVK